MHPGYEIPGIHNPNPNQQLHQQHQHIMASENNCGPVLLSMNQTHILEQIHALPTTQQILLDPHHFFQPQYLSTAAGGVSSAFFPVNFKLGLNEVCTSSSTHHDNNNNKNSSSSTVNINEGQDADNLFRGSEQYEVPEARQTSLGLMHHHHCWQNQQDSVVKHQQQQQSFWEPLASELSNENSEIIDRREHSQMIQKESTAKNFGELEAIYKRYGTVESINQKGTIENLPIVNVGKEATRNERKKRKKKKKEAINYTKFFEKLVKQVMEHQENLHQKFAEVIERLEGERREREEVWRNQELAHFEEEAAVRAKEKAMAASREAIIVSYLEKITGERINLGSFDHNNESNSTDPSDDLRMHGGAQTGQELMRSPGS